MCAAPSYGPVGSMLKGLGGWLRSCVSPFQAHGPAATSQNNSDRPAGNILSRVLFCVCHRFVLCVSHGFLDDVTPKFLAHIDISWDVYRHFLGCL